MNAVTDRAAALGLPHSLPPYTDFVAGLRSYQMDAANAILESARSRRGRTFTVLMARQAGKNELSARVELQLLMENAGREVDGIKCAPTLEPQCRISLSRLWGCILEAGLEADAAIEGHAIRFGHAHQRFLSADASANVVGHTASLLLEVDEAQDVDVDKFDREFRPMAAATGATTVYYGTLWDDSTLLERATQTNLELDRRDGIRRHFAADWTVVAEWNPQYARYVEGERARLGESHPLFLTQYALKTISGGGRLFSASHRAQLHGIHARQSAPRSGEVYVAGLDLGGQSFETSTDGGLLRMTGPSPNRRDASVLTIARAVMPPSDAVVQEPRLEIVEHLAFSGTAHDALFARLADLLGEVWRVRRVAVDATGLGETLARLLARRLGDDTVRPLKFTAESKSKLGYWLLAAVNGGRLKVYAADGSPEYAEFWREAELARVHYRPSRQMSFFVAPSDGHDDYLVSAALAVRAAQDIQAGPRVARGRFRDA